MPLPEVINKSIERKPANEPSSPASVSVPYNNTKAGAQMGDNVYAGLENAAQSHSRKNPRGQSSRNQKRNVQTELAPQLHADPSR